MGVLQEGIRIDGGERTPRGNQIMPFTFSFLNRKLPLPLPEFPLVKVFQRAGGGMGMGSCLAGTVSAWDDEKVWK